MKWAVESSQESIEVTSSGPRPDPTWSHVDAAGHLHRWKGHDLPTLESLPDGEPYWCETCQEVHQDTVLGCSQCGEAITPAMLGPSEQREFIPGRVSGRLVVLENGSRRVWHLNAGEAEALAGEQPEAALERVMLRLPDESSYDDAAAL